MRECVQLVKHGFPFDVAFSVPNDLRVAWLIIAGECDGGEFDWASGNFRRRK
jgi:hypothetical protein